MKGPYRPRTWYTTGGDITVTSLVWFVLLVLGLVLVLLSPHHTTALSLLSCNMFFGTKFEMLLQSLKCF
jgi:hypothetical protein